MTARCPSWCTGVHDDSVVHRSAQHTSDRVHVWMLQVTNDPNIWVDGVAVDPQYGPALASLFARLGHAELAAAVARLGEMAAADTDLAVAR